MLTDIPNMIQLNKIGKNISDSLKKLNGMYNKALMIGSTNLDFLYKYSVFLKYVVSDDISNEEVLTKYFIYL